MFRLSVFAKVHDLFIGFESLVDLVAGDEGVDQGFLETFLQLLERAFLVLDFLD